MSVSWRIPSTARNQPAARQGGKKTPREAGTGLSLRFFRGPRALSTSATRGLRGPGRKAMMGFVAKLAESREKAGKVATWLIEKRRPDEAVSLLAAWAAAGGNDSAGQSLLAEALRVDPSAKLAQQAFERMEGMEGDHAALEQAMIDFGEEYIAKIEAEMRKPSFRRAQM